LSAVSSENYNDIFQEKSIITAFKEAGFETLYISIQVPNRSLIDYFSEEADRRIDISPRENQLYTDNRPDGEMLPYLRQVIDSSDRNLFIVLHTYGSHFDYTKRYPREFAQFLPDQASSVNHEERDRVQNAYDNSIFYTDYLLDEMIAVLEQTQSCSALFYCADHGEDLMDDDRNRFLHASPTPTYYQLHVASIAWFSESYRQQFPAKYEASQRARQRPYSTGWVFHTLADMASLRSPYIDTTRALTNDGFTPTLQRMYITDHNQAIEFYNTGLAPEDLKALDQHHIAYPKEQVHRILY
ncbi:MAG: phosphoethanolamine transferase, partial [Alistipes sp.]|nr:phosphoethanolamine transferase [Alistipes sp.]